MPRCELVYRGADLALRSPYDAAFVAALHQAVPRSAHTWSKPYWLIDPAYGQQVIRLVETFYMEQLTLPRAPTTGAAAADTRALYVEYVGRAKPRDDGSAWASGYQRGDDRMRPSLVFPETVLRAWFNQAGMETPEEADPRSSAAHSAPQTHYSTLGLAATAAPEELRKARNSLAKQWHPDHCREPGAAAIFRAIQDAYELLSNPAKRKRYDAGLRMQASLAPSAPDARARMRASLHRNLQAQLDAYDDTLYGYRAPRRCGMIMAEVVERLGKLHVQKITAWEDITDRRGRTMVSSWPAGADLYEVCWY